ncbi:MAG: hypothetical protein ABIF85_04760 [Nanoarchaeota archaeon]
MASVRKGIETELLTNVGIAVLLLSLVLLFSYSLMSNKFGALSSSSTSDPESPCTKTCSTSPGCKTSAPSNSVASSGICCGAGESCYKCASGYTWTGSACTLSCTDTCASLGYNCGTQTVCGASKNCGTCTAPKTCNSGVCVSPSSPLTATIIQPYDGDIYANGDWLRFLSFALGGQPDYTFPAYSFEWKSDKDGSLSTNMHFGMNTLTTNKHTITVTATDIKGVKASDNIIIEVKPAGTLTANIDRWIDEFAKGEIINLWSDVAGGTPPYTFVWNSDLEGDFSTVQGPSIDSSSWTVGTHTITLKVTDNIGNIATSATKINIVEMTAQINPTEGTTASYGNMLWFSPWITGGTPPYAYLWVSDLDGILNTAYAFSKDDLTEGLHTITLTITDSSGTPKTIVKTRHIQITPPPPLTITIDSPLNGATVARGNYISFNETFSGGVWPFKFTWTSDKDGEIFTSPYDIDFARNNLSVGSHKITLSVNDNAKQIAKDEVNIIITPPAPLAATIISPINGATFKKIDSLIKFNSSVTGGIPPYTYKWTSNKDGDITPSGLRKDYFSTNDLSINAHTITLKITDSASATTSATVTINVNAECAVNNFKNNAKYASKETFMISDSNWQDALSLVPLAIWKEGATIRKYPALIYHHETATAFDADSTIHFMQLYGPNHATTIGTIPANLNNLLVAAKPVGAGLKAASIVNIKSSDYFSYWSSFNSLVVVDYNNYKAGLMAAVFASNKNSPIIFVNSANLPTYKSLINGKTIYVVENLDATTQSYIDANSGCNVKYTLEDLQKWYLTETGSDKLIFLNPKDLSIKMSYSFFPQKSSFINTIFSKMSLAAPFLAAAKEEAIMYTEVPDSGTNAGCIASAALTNNFNTADADSANFINSLNLMPTYLTVVAAPNAIPDSLYNRCSGIWQFRWPVDWKYASLNNLNSLLYVGRIYGITVADASSHIAKSLFFDQIIQDLYGTNYNIISVGHSFSCDESDVQYINDKTSASGYNSICFVENAGYPNCTIDTSPLVSNYTNKRYITYADHGGPGSWANTLSFFEIPWLDLPFADAQACLTNNYWQGSSATFGPSMIRKGAVGYWGSSGVAYLDCGSNSKHLKRLTGTEHDTITTGELFTEESSHGFYYLLGDPTIQLKLKEVTW